MRHEFDGLVDMIKDDQGGGEHEESVRETRYRIMKWDRGFSCRFEMSYSVIRDESNCSAFLISTT